MVARARANTCAPLSAHVGQIAECEVSEPRFHVGIGEAGQAQSIAPRHTYGRAGFDALAVGWGTVARTSRCIVRVYF
jgi:hypothetical protein